MGRRSMTRILSWFDLSETHTCHQQLFSFFHCILGCNSPARPDVLLFIAVLCYSLLSFPRLPLGTLHSDEGGRLTPNDLSAPTYWKNLPTFSLLLEQALNAT